MEDDNKAREYRFQRDWQYTVQINGKTISVMDHLRCDDPADFDEGVKFFVERFPKEEFPNDVGEPQATPKQDVTALQSPKCNTCGKLMVLRNGKFGQFWSCGTKNTDGTWCKGKPANI